MQTVFDAGGPKAYYEELSIDRDKVTWTKQEASMRRELQKIEIYRHAQSQFEAREAIKLQRALSYAQRKAAASPLHTNPTATPVAQPVWIQSTQ